VNKISEQSRIEKTAVLPLAGMPVQASDLPSACTADRMFADFPEEARFTNAHLHRIQRETTPHGAPWIPAPVRGRRNTCATLGGLLRRYEHQLTAARSESTFDRITFDSMEACEARTGIPRHLLSTAKEHGCPAFEGSGRIRLAVLVRWLFTAGATGEVTDWAAHSDKFKALNEEVKYRESIDELVPKAEITAMVQEFSAICFGGIKRLRLEGPREFEMRDKAWLKTALETKCADILKQAEAIMEQLKQKQAAPADR